MLEVRDIVFCIFASQAMESLCAGDAAPLLLFLFLCEDGEKGEVAIAGTLLTLWSLGRFVFPALLCIQGLAKSCECKDTLGETIFGFGD